jgi:hypothetical protein
VAALYLEASAIFRPTSAVLATGPAYVIEDFARGEPVGQTFRIPDDGLVSVGVQLWADRPASIDIAWRLVGTAQGASNDGSRAWAPAYEMTAPLRLPRGRSAHYFTFNPIIPSARRVYQFQIQQLAVRSLDPTQPGRPTVGVVASRDDALPEGNVVSWGCCHCATGRSPCSRSK